jgi:hypothetical protein
VLQLHQRRPAEQRQRDGELHPVRNVLHAHRTIHARDQRVDAEQALAEMLVELRLSPGVRSCSDIRDAPCTVQLCMPAP